MAAPLPARFHHAQTSAGQSPVPWRDAGPVPAPSIPAPLPARHGAEHPGTAACPPRCPESSIPPWPVPSGPQPHEMHRDAGVCL